MTSLSLSGETEGKCWGATGRCGHSSPWSSGSPGEVFFLCPRKAGRVIILECEPRGSCSRPGAMRAHTEATSPRRTLEADSRRGWSRPGSCGAQTSKPRRADPSSPHPCLTCGIFRSALGQAGSHEPGSN